MPEHSSLEDLEAAAEKLAEREEEQLVTDFQRRLDYNMRKVCSVVIGAWGVLED